MTLKRREARTLAILLAAALILLAHRTLVLTRPRTPEVQHAASPPPKVDLNRASLAEIEALPGIGPKAAAEIVSRRPFQSLADLAQVPGIGPRGLDRLSAWVRVSP